MKEFMLVLHAYTVPAAMIFGIVLFVLLKYNYYKTLIVMFIGVSILIIIDTGYVIENAFLFYAGVMIVIALLFVLWSELRKSFPANAE